MGSERQKEIKLRIVHDLIGVESDINARFLLRWA